MLALYRQRDVIQDAAQMCAAAAAVVVVVDRVLVD